MITEDPNYDPLEDITNLLLTSDGLDSVDQYLDSTRAYKLELQRQLDAKRLELEDGTYVENTDSISKVFSSFEETKKLASETKVSIASFTHSITHLDNAKRNLTLSLNFFQNLKILTDCFIACQDLLKSGTYKEMVDPFRIMSSLAEQNLADYTAIDEVNALLASVNRLKADTLARIKKDYERVLSIAGKSDPGTPISQNLELLQTDLREGACRLLESSSGSKLELTDWCISKFLYDLKEIFNTDDEAGSLENISRRYAYFKKVLNDFTSNYASYFMPEWDMPRLITEEFLSITSKHLEILLKLEFRDKNPSIELFINSLQTTQEFENYINVRFSHRIKAKRLSSLFEPYLTLWISNQDKVLEKKMLGYMSENRFPGNVNDSLVVPSSADLFRTYRNILTQTFDFFDSGQNEDVIMNLCVFLNKWLIDYSNKILQPLLLPEHIDIEDKHEACQYTVLLINTADYCSTTLAQLEEKLAAVASNKDKISSVFAKTSNIYGELVAKGIDFLLKRIIRAEISFVWREFDNINWDNSIVENYSRYMSTLQNVLKGQDAAQQNEDSKTTLVFILELFNRDVFRWNFLDKVMDLVTEGFVNGIVKLLQPVPPYATGIRRRFNVEKTIRIGEQILLDTELLKKIFQSLPDAIAEASQTTAPAKRVQKHIDHNLHEITNFIKILITPGDVPNNYAESYLRLTDGNKRVSVWAFILAIKGFDWDLSLWVSLWNAYKTTNIDIEDAKLANGLFIFSWAQDALSNFETNMMRIRNPEWAKFVAKDLRIKGPVRKGVGKNYVSTS